MRTLHHAKDLNGRPITLELGPGPFACARRWLVQYFHDGSQWPVTYFCTRKEAREYAKAHKHYRVVDCGCHEWDYLWDDSHAG